MAKGQNQYTKNYKEGEELMRVFPLKKMPEEIRKYILETQSSLKVTRRTSQVSMESAIYQIIREHKTSKEKPVIFGGLKN